jgi:CBS domain-containing protein
VADELADELAPELADELVDGLALDAGVEHVDVIMSLFKVTSPFRASTRPFTVTPPAIVIDVRAMMVPPNVEPEPRVAELVTCQKTLQGLPPLMKSTRLAEAVMRSDGAWKIQTELESFPPSRVSVPVRLSVEAAL